jgi:glutamine---fructose-6-phosphate transaminase (isomerizing)
MCGIIGILGKNKVTDRLVNSLKRLEYRGYDSAGVAIIDHEENICVVKAQGKISNLELELKDNSLEGNIGIAHTRWATHGKASKTNAHPHYTSRVGVVHNGIIENFAALKENLINQGYKFSSATDTEVIPVLITSFLEQGFNPLAALQQAIKLLHGSFAIAAIFAQEQIMLGARNGAPLVVGYGDDEYYLGSDILALTDLTDKTSYLEQGDVVYLSKDKVIIYDALGKIAQREIKVVHLDKSSIEKDGFADYMLKEIYQQPSIIANSLATYVDFVNQEITLPKFSFSWGKIDKIYIVACGTSYYAGMCAKYWFETYAQIGVEIEIASEFRYRDVCFKPNGLCIFISQSGETADTLAAMRYAKACGQHTLCLVNVATSSMARDDFLETLAGIEIGVASTKAFSAQLMSLIVLVLDATLQKKLLNPTKLKHYFDELALLPGKISQQLNCAAQIQEIAKDLASVKSILYIGRGTAFAMALEGALKLKELSYIHAEALASGELKHGTIALIDEKMPVVVIAPTDKLFEKTLSNAHEIAARGGKIISISSAAGNQQLASIASNSINVLECDDFFAPLLYLMPLQLLGYYTAKFLGYNIDQPRNLAKSVTVE